MSSTKENIAKYAEGNQEDNYCRLCFTKAFKLRNVFPYGDDPNTELYRKVCNLALVKLDNRLEPDCCICSRCITQLDEFSQFQQQCIEYNQLLYQIRGLEVLSEQQKVTSVPQSKSIQNSAVAKQEKRGEDVDPFDTSHNSTGPRKSVKRTTKAPRRYSPIVKRATKRKSIRKTPQQDTESSFEENASDSSDDYKTIAKRKIKTGRSFGRRPGTTPEKPQRSRCSKNVNIDYAQSDTKQAKVLTSTDFIVYNAGHGGINIMAGGYRYYKYRYYRKGSEIRYGWQCIEPDCPSQLYTSSLTTGTIYWRDRFFEHNHPSDNVEQLMETKEEDATTEELEEESSNEYQLLSSGRGRHTYKLMKFSSGREILMYGEHRHRLLTERPDGIKIFGCCTASCRAIIYISRDNEMRVYCGSYTSTEEAADQAYRKTSKIVRYDGHYFVYSGRKLEDRNLTAWNCVMRKSLECQTVIYCTKDDTITTLRHQINYSHNHPADAFKLEEGMQVVDVKKEALPLESTDYHIAKNTLKTDFLIFEGLRYSIVNSKVDGSKTCRCLESENCAAYVFLLSNGTVVKYSNFNEHSHPIPNTPKSIYEFDYIIETIDVSLKPNGIKSLIRRYKDYDYRQSNQKEPGFHYYRCVDKNMGCAAAFITNEDFTNIRETIEQHNHPSPEVEKEQRKTMILDEGRTDFTMASNGDGHDVLQYQGNRYCHFYNHKEGWRVWRCFSGPRCRATVFQDPSASKINDVERFAHAHLKGWSQQKVNSGTNFGNDPDADSESRESVD